VKKDARRAGKKITFYLARQIKSSLLTLSIREEIMPSTLIEKGIICLAQALF